MEKPKSRPKSRRIKPSVLHLFTDASFIHQRGIASWGAMLIDGLSSHTQAGLIGARIQNATQGEAHAVRLALSHFRDLIVPGDTLLVHTDNQGVSLQLHERDFMDPPSDRIFREQMEEIRAIAEQAQCILISKWIKAHQGKATECWRSIINQHVDFLARSISKEENSRRIAAGDKGRLPGPEQIRKS